MKRRRIGTFARWTAWSASAPLVALSSLTVVSCGGGQTTTTPRPSSPPFFLLGWGTLRPLVTVGSSIQYGISATPPAPASIVSSTIAVTMSGMPSGLTVDPDSFSLEATGSGGQVVVTIKAASSLPPGDHPITVTGKNNSGSYSITVTVGVVNPTPPGVRRGH
jgi:hypothetical protein